MERKERPKQLILRAFSVSFSPSPPRKQSLFANGWRSWAAVLLSRQNGLLTTSNPLKGMMAKHSHPLTKTNNSDRDLCLTNKTSTLIPTRRDWTWSSSNSEATTSITYASAEWSKKRSMEDCHNNLIRFMPTYQKKAVPLCPR